MFKQLKPLLSKDQRYTFMLVPHGSNAPALEFKVHHRALVAAGCVVLVLMLGAFSSFMYSSILSRRLVTYYEMRAVGQTQRDQLAGFSKEAAELRTALDELAKRDSELRQQLGLKTETKNAVPPSIVFSEERKKVDAEARLNAGNVYGEFKKAEAELARRRASISELQKMITDIRQRFSATPSIWPTYGKIVSGFGFRYFPWRGFHSGVDISVWYGAPVRATADGVVSFVGWQGGYGKAVVVDHGNGFSTLYGHNSAFAVVAGEQVKKGQVICYVGTTGFSTGPHCHYEVRKNDRPVNPVAYLGLNLLTASKTWAQ